MNNQIFEATLKANTQKIKQLEGQITKTFERRVAILQESKDYKIGAFVDEPTETIFIKGCPKGVPIEELEDIIKHLPKNVRDYGIVYI